MSDMAEPTTDAPQEAPAEQAAVPNDAVMARLDEMSQQLGALTQQPEPEWQGGISDMPYMDDQGFEPDFQQQPYPQQEYQPGQYAPDNGLVDQQQAQAQAMAQLQQYIATQVQQATQPIVIEQKVKELERQYPELADPQNAQKVFNEAVLYAKRMGNPEMARNPELIELVHLAQQARSNAAQETPADDGTNSVHLEGGGAAPTEPEMDAADRMLQAWGKL